MPFRYMRPVWVEPPRSWAHAVRRALTLYLFSSELRLGSMLLAVFLGLLANPQVMSLNRTWGLFADTAPQPVWTVLTGALAALQLASFRYRVRWFRLTASVAAGLFWWALAVGQIYVWPAGAGLFMYFLLALLNLLSLYLIGTERFHRAPHGH